MCITALKFAVKQFQSWTGKGSIIGGSWRYLIGLNSVFFPKILGIFVDLIKDEKDNFIRTEI